MERLVCLGQRPAVLQALDLQEVQLHRRLATEEGDENLDFAFLQIDVVDLAGKVDERPVDDSNTLPDLEADFDPRLFDTHLAKDLLDFVIVEWHRPWPGPTNPVTPGVLRTTYQALLDASSPSRSSIICTRT